MIEVIIKNHMLYADNGTVRYPLHPLTNIYGTGWDTDSNLIRDRAEWDRFLNGPT